MNILITSGGTKVPIDSVRDITNMSQGTFGAKLATAALKHNHDVRFLRARGSKSPFTVTIDIYKEGFPDLKALNALTDFYLDTNYKSIYREISYRNYNDYATALEREVKGYEMHHDGTDWFHGCVPPDVVILAAAVSDYGTEAMQGKIRSQNDLVINLHPLEKLISKIKQWNPNVYLVGFKLLVEATEAELLAAAYHSIESNGCDMVIANDLRSLQANEHRLYAVRANHQLTIIENGDAQALMDLIEKESK